MFRRHRVLFNCLVVALAGSVVFDAGTICRANITINTVAIGNPGNAPDTAVMTVDGSTGYGAVGYNYRIGKYDVTVGQYTAFLNAVAATDTFGLYNPSMASDLTIAGIAQNGVSGGFSYSVIDSPNKPITYVSWGDAARFANWLHNGQPTGDEGPATTETGAYTLNGTTDYAALNLIARNANAKWFIPSENEWYKAACYDPATGHYWNYATRTNTKPTSAPPDDTPNTANFNPNGVGPHNCDVNGNCLTDVGAYTASASAYGTFDQTGDVDQWNEATIVSLYRGQRGARGTLTRLICRLLTGVTILRTLRASLLGSAWRPCLSQAQMYWRYSLAARFACGRSCQREPASIRVLFAGIT
jgi:hypothetical protein